ncbi:MAG: T9SS type A sorting domain-containing protein, partial [Bacteroidota bacterium]|nr:T9SS type A sorting domain-containing protein [Bacteroidota bacterium]
ALDALSDVPHLQFRVAIGTGGEQAIGNQGFAFDNFYVGERVKFSVLEHFTNSASIDAVEADEVVEQFVSDYSEQVIDLQYHMDYPGEDPMNLNNPVPPYQRAFTLGVPAVPYALLNGGPGPEYRYDFSDESEEPDGEVLLTESLEIPPFDVNLSTNFLSNRLEGKVRVTCKKNGFDSNIQLYVVVLEQLVTAYTGVNQTTEFRNVVLAILPSDNGTLLGNTWGAGVSKDLDFSWNYASYLEDEEELIVVAFIMDRDHDQILQSAFVEYSPGTGVEDRAAADTVLAIYPNPAREYVYINFGTEVEQSGQLNIVDLTGRTILTSEILPGYSIYKLDISDLSQGTYLVQWMDSGMIRGRAKLVRGL